VAVGAGLGSALCFAVSSVLQQRGASRAPMGSGMHLGLVAHLVGRPMWIGGLLAAVGTVTLQAIALASGPLALVQPLLVCALLFALPASVLLEKRRPSLVEWGWAVLLVAGLAVFLRAAHPGTGPPLPDDGRLLQLGAVGGALAAGAAAIGYGPGRRHRAVLLGLAAGIVYGLTASLIKYSVALADVDAAHLLTGWPVYALLLVGAGGVVLSQAAYQAGPLAGALPPMVIADPIVAIIVAVEGFGEELTTDPAAVVFEAVGSCAMAMAIIRLARLASGRGPRTGGTRRRRRMAKRR
jgi:drug/metabolite transporter (DMT)-like permease